MNDERTLRWGILGTARIADKVAAAIQNAAGAELVAVASRSAERASAWAEERSIPQSYGSYAGLLDDENIDAVYIPLPPSLHAEWTIAAAEKGKHVLCEKPTALNSTEVESMIAACEQNNVQLMDGVMWVHHPRTRDMRNIMTGGSMGRLRRVTSAFSFHWDVVPEGDLRLSKELGGGSLLDLGWYNVRATLWAFGEMPERVYGTAQWHNDVDMSFSGMMWFADNRFASFDCSFDTLARRWFEVTGTTGSIVCDDFVIPWQADKVRYWTHADEGESVERTSATDIQEVQMIEEFTRCAFADSLNPRWPNETLATQRICDALSESARTGKSVEVNRAGIDEGLLKT
ncbi:MAG: Gfo/Idh/MocA family oxidoreductase [Planctomycetaceae bacterium]